MKKNKNCRRFWALLLAVSLIFSMMPGMAFAAEGQQMTAPDFNPTQYVTAQDVFEQIKGSNTSMDHITSDLIEKISGEGDPLYVYVDPETKKVTSWGSGAYKKNVKLEWVSSSDPEYIGISKSEAGTTNRILKLRKRPEAAKSEPDKIVTLTMELTGVQDSVGCEPATLNIPLTIKAGDRINTPTEWVKINLFDFIKGENKDTDSITTGFDQIRDGKLNVKVGSDGVLTKTSSQYTADCEITFTSSNPTVFNIDTNTVTRQEQDTPVTITATILDRGTKLSEEFPIEIIVLGKQAPTANPLDCITEDLLFDAIKGSNVSKDAITSSLTKPESTNYIDDFYAKLNEDGSFAGWWGGRYGAKANITLKSISNASILKKNKNSETIDIVKVPEVDTVVNVTFKVEEVGNSANTKEIVLPLTVKGAPEANILDVVTPESIFAAIKGSNIDADNIYSSLIIPVGASNFNEFVAVIGNNRIIGWENDSQLIGVLGEGKAKITLNPITSDILALNESGNAIEIKKVPSEDTVCDLSFTVEEVGNSGNTKIVTIPVTVKDGSTAAIKQELQDALDTYLKPERIEYTTYKKDGESFISDYNSDHVRYSFQLPNVSSDAGYGYKEVETEILFDHEALQQHNINKRILEPIRSDVNGKEKKTTVTYKLTKNGVSAVKTIDITIPALTTEEIAEEVRLLEDVRKNLFDGIRYLNYDKDHITDSLAYAVAEVHYDNNSKLVWINDAKSKKYYGLQFPANDSWVLDYKSGEPGIFSATNMVLQKRPKEDTTLTATHSIKSIQLDKYIAMYPDNKELQKLKDQTVSIDLTVKAVNAEWKSIKVSDKTITPVKNVKEYSVLTDTTLETVPVTVDLQNKGAELVIAGDNCTHKFSKEVPLTNGFAQFTVSVSDEDKMQAGTKQTSDVRIAVVSKGYLEENIVKLPENADAADQKQLKAAKELWKQYSALSAEDKAKIVGKDRLERYGEKLGDPKAALRDELKLAGRKLFDGIRGTNPSGSKVFADLEEIYYGKIDDSEGNNKVIWSKDASGSDIKIDWISSSSPEYVDVHNGNDFETSYVRAFRLAKRPHHNPVSVTFKAKLTHLADPSVTEMTDVTFRLLPYDARLKVLKIDEFPAFELQDGVTEYTVFNSGSVKTATLSAEAEIPSASITVNGKPLKEKKMQVALTGDSTSITVKVDDGGYNTLNDKWDVKTYTISVIKSVSALKEEIDRLPNPDTITKDNYLNYKSRVDSLNESYDALSQSQKDQIGTASAEKLAAVKAKIAQISLAVAKEKVLIELEAYQNTPSDYTEANWEKVLKEKEKGKAAINKAATEQAVLSALAEAKTAVYAVPRKDSGESAADTSIREIEVLPGDYKASKLPDGTYSVTVPESVEHVLVRVLTVNPKASTMIHGKAVSAENNWTSSERFSIVKGGKTEVPIQVTSSDGTAENTYRLVINRMGTAESEKVNVTFELIGDSKHGDKPHQHFETWISSVKVTMPKGATVKNLTDKMLINSNIPFTAKGNYITSINGLSEFDNGPKSGWMYSVNGQIPNKTYDEIVLKEGDSVKWFYTDNYSNDVSGEDWGEPEKTPVVTVGTPGSAVTTTPTEVTVTGDTAKVTVKPENMTEAIRQAKEKLSKEIVLDVKEADMKKASKLSAELDTAVLKQIEKETGAVIVIRSPLGRTEVTRTVLAEIASKAKDAKTVFEISLNEEKKPVLTVKSGNEVIYTTENEPEKDPAEEMKQIRKQLKKITLAARSSKTAKKNNAVRLVLSKKEKETLKQIEAAGYDVKYKYYRSVYKSKKYQGRLISDGLKYVNTAGKYGRMYYYKARIQVYDGDGKLVAQTALKQCKYAARKWTKKAK